MAIEGIEHDVSNHLENMFIRYMSEKIGPWFINISLLKYVCLIEPIEEYERKFFLSHINVFYNNIVNKFCPYSLIIPKDLDINKKIFDIDDNSELIYACGTAYLLDTCPRVLKTSNLSVIVMLRLSE